MPSPLRLTMPTVAVLDTLLEAAVSGTALWGLRICEETALGSGTVYPILDRLVQIGWIESSWEDEQPSGRPRRRYYRITDAGQQEYAAALADRDARWRRQWSARRPSAAGGVA